MPPTGVNRANKVKDGQEDLGPTYDKYNQASTSSSLAQSQTETQLSLPRVIARLRVGPRGLVRPLTIVLVTDGSSRYSRHDVSTANDNCAPTTTLKAVVPSNRSPLVFESRTKEQVAYLGGPNSRT